MTTKSLSARLDRWVASSSFGFLALVASAFAQPAGSGTIQGQVINVSSGNYLNNVHVTVQGTNIEAFTNATGNYWLTNVPAGQAVVETKFIGMETRVATVTVIAGGAAVQNFDLTLASSSDGKVVQLDTLSVEAQSMTGQAVALTEQRNAPNVKNVISLDEFVDQAEGNIGEFIKFVPGLDLQYNPFSPQFATIRGMRSSGTVILFDGVPTASALVGTSRSFDMNTAGSGNIDRIEVSKVPTPDVPANAIGGTINVVSKTGFSRKTPLFTYNTFMTYNAIEGEFDPGPKKVAGPDGKSSKRPVQPGYDLSYILPLNKNLGFTFALTRAPRSNEVEYRSPTWNTNTGILNAYQFNELVSDVDIRTAKATMDWKFGQASTVQLSFYDMDRRSLTRQHFSVVTPGAGSTGDSNFIQGAATSVGTSAQNLSGNQQYRALRVMSAKYNYSGPAWDGALFFSRSEGGANIKDIDDGFFGTVASSQTGMIIRAENLSQIGERGIPNIAATRAGAPVNTFDATNNSIASATNAASVADSAVTSYGAHLSRNFDLTVPMQIRVGVYEEVLERDNKGGTLTYTFTPPGGTAARLASLYDVFNDPFSRRAPLTEISGRSVYARYLSSAKLYDLYRTNPSWFVLNEAAALTNRVNGSVELEETITAAYLRMDNKFLNNKLLLVSGVRYERTEDDGRGPLNDIAATYQRDANGNFIRNSAGQLVRITTNAVENARLQYTERGYSRKSSYDGFYPSFNARYAFTDRLVLRAGYARTIFRPELDEVIASVVITDPNGESSTRRITVVDGKLKPWTADAFDISFEAYDIKGITASVALFQKNIQDFFAVTESQITSQELEEFGLPADYTDYFVRRTRNAGNAKLSGVELSYRQTWNFIPRFGRYIQTFANLTSLALDGDQTENFEEFSPRNINAGIGFVHKRYSVKLNMHNNKWVRRTAAAANANNRAGGFNFRAPSTRLDFSAEYRLNKWFSVYYSVRNLTAEPVRLEFRSPDLPADYLRPRNYQFVAANHTLGIKGRF